MPLFFFLSGFLFNQTKYPRFRHFITTRIEHPAVVEPCRFLERLGARVTYVPVDRFGRVDPDVISFVYNIIGSRFFSILHIISVPATPLR
jgi:cysteine sulfinate desulfinase/cysteine desulfurase-like protein